MCTVISFFSPFGLEVGAWFRPQEGLAIAKLNVWDLGIYFRKHSLVFGGTSLPTNSKHFQTAETTSNLSTGGSWDPCSRSCFPCYSQAFCSILKYYFLYVSHSLCSNTQHIFDILATVSQWRACKSAFAAAKTSSCLKTVIATFIITILFWENVSMVLKPTSSQYDY